MSRILEDIEVPAQVAVIEEEHFDAVTPSMQSAKSTRAEAALNPPSAIKHLQAIGEQCHLEDIVKVNEALESGTPGEISRGVRAAVYRLVNQGQIRVPEAGKAYKQISDKLIRMSLHSEDHFGIAQVILNSDDLHSAIEEEIQAQLDKSPTFQKLRTAPEPPPDGAVAYANLGRLSKTINFGVDPQARFLANRKLDAADARSGADSLSKEQLSEVKAALVAGKTKNLDEMTPLGAARAVFTNPEELTRVLEDTMRNEMTPGEERYARKLLEGNEHFAAMSDAVRAKAISSGDFYGPAAEKNVPGTPTPKWIAKNLGQGEAEATKQLDAIYKIGQRLRVKYGENLFFASRAARKTRAGSATLGDLRALRELKEVIAKRHHPNGKL